ncbi:MULTISPECIES: helix-turn-helix domain-containing protein [unclassified Streptomyces]|uniref:helix-turn-helix domain-containing protein n=1 Tax=unclassified Streptomyces TaxID=2593676 RepID=UPI00278C19FF|nr:MULTISPECIES: helix-turn-helix transcriptional regulator [unclassified Streptomyces]
MTNREPQDGNCLHCKRPFQRSNPVGRRQEYCSQRCRRRAQRARGLARQAQPAAAGTLPLGQSIAEDLQLLAARLLSAEYEGWNLAARLRLADEVSREVEYYLSATVHEAHARGASWEQVAAAAAVSTATARKRWAHKKVERRLSRRATDRSAARQYDAIPPANGAPRDEQARAADAARAGMLLAAALSYLHRRSGLTVKDAAAQTGRGLSAPYVSRILSGERLPSWRVTEALVTVCGGDPREVTMLWEHAQGMAPPVRHPLPDAVHRLHAALRGLHLAAACPTSERVCEAGGTPLTPDDVTAVLQGRMVPTWPQTGALVKALGGMPADMRPLWEAVEYGFLVRLDPQGAEGAPRLPLNLPDDGPGDGTGRNRSS